MNILLYWRKTVRVGEVVQLKQNPADLAEWTSVVSTRLSKRETLWRLGIQHKYNTASETTIEPCHLISSSLVQNEFLL